jgi:hypothetical protein
MPGSSVGSSGVAGTDGRTPCAAKSAVAVAAAPWSYSHVFPYAGKRPWQVPTPRGKVGEDEC